jgi:gluconokinase
MIKLEPQLIVVMGVSGCGKTTIGTALSARTGLPFYDGDDFHSESNKQKMSSGKPLNDDDRKPWLKAIVDFSAEECASGSGLIIACSALKHAYREQLRTLSWPVKFVHLHAPFEVIHARMKQRTDHYMPESLLRSQFETLESPVNEHGVIEVSIEQSVEAATDRILLALENE